MSTTNLSQKTGAQIVLIVAAFVISSLSYLFSQGFSEKLLALYAISASLAGIFLCIFTKVKDEAEQPDYTERDRKADIFLALFSLLAQHCAFFGYAFTHYGLTEKPIEQLDGIYLGETYTEADLKERYTNVWAFEWGHDDCRFYIEDDAQPTMKICIITDRNDTVTEVALTYRNINPAITTSLKNTLIETAYAQYGGKPSLFEDFELFDGRNMLDIEKSVIDVTITIATTLIDEEEDAAQAAIAKENATREAAHITSRATSALKGK